ncbi:MAG: hypothetical protein A2W22_03615 [Candidatus Levybacteria bacterium RBG_16_35_11]|nr:MAG: hypothetical protein A2W22_03615 [Candidatus Levybacteria bacterium RBG_16_35_11]
MSKLERLNNPDQLKNMVNEYWNRLGLLFPRAKNMPAPSVIFSRDFGDFGTAIPELWSKSANADGLYIARLHSLVFNLDKPYPIESSVLAEEITHASTFIEGDVLVITRDFKDFNGYVDDFGARLVRQSKRIELPFMFLDVNEFFAPIGEAFLLGEKYKDDWGWQKAFPSEPFTFPVSENELSLYTRVFVHLPRLAGEMLVRIYRKDTPRLIAENPTLLSSSAASIWENFCLPLLKNGELT